MTNQDPAEIKYGMHLAATLPDIMPQQAGNRIKPIYDDIQQGLRVPIVNLIFRTLANYPDYLEPAWQQIASLVRTRGFERAADALRTEALIDPPPSPAELDMALPDGADHLRRFNDTIHYVLPKLLLVVTVLARTPQAQAAEPPAAGLFSDTLQIPGGVADGSGKVEMVDPENTDPEVSRLFEAIKQAHGHPLVSSYYRGIANWPDFLRTAWKSVSTRVGTPEYAARRQALIEQAATHARHWAPVRVTPAPAAQKEIDAVLAAFRMKFIPEMLLDVALVKSLLDGPEAARRSGFSAA